MAIQPICDKCGKQLKSFGGLLFSPPDKKSNVKKYHLCKTCFEQVAAKLNNKV